MPLANSMNRFRRFKGKSLQPNAAPSQDKSPTSQAAKPSRFRRILGTCSVTQYLDKKKISSPVPPTVTAFAEQITEESLSHLLIWLFYYDIVELPMSPANWYARLPAMDMGGWIELGRFLQTVPHGFQLARLDNVINRLQLRKPYVLHCLDRVSKPGLMRWSEVAAIVHYSRESSLREQHGLGTVQACLQAVQATTASLTPRADTEFKAWQTNVSNRVAEFLDVVVNPGLSMVRGGMRLLSGETDNDEAYIRYLYRAMQAERDVPLAQYGIVPNPSTHSENSRTSSELPVITPEQAAWEAEEGFHFSIPQVLQQNRELRNEVAALRAKNEELLVNRPLPPTPTSFPARVLKRKPVRGDRRSQSNLSGSSPVSNQMHPARRASPALPLNDDIPVQLQPHPLCPPAMRS
jgi:hypothetical protein